MGRSVRITQEQVAALTAQIDRAYHLALRTTGSSALSEDAVQEAFSKILQNPPKLHDELKLVYYFLSIVRHTAVDLVRTNRRRKRREENNAVTVSQSRTPEDHHTTREAAQTARRALEGLPQEEREAVGLCCELDLTRREASGLLGIPERTLTDRVNRGLEKLRQVLLTKGYAAVAAPALAASLRDLGAIPASHSLTGSMQNQVRNLGNSVRLKSLHTASGTGSSWLGILGIASVITAAIVGGILLSNASGVPVSTPAREKVPVEVSKIYIGKDGVKQSTFSRTWHFDTGIPQEFRVIRGEGSIKIIEGKGHLVVDKFLAMLLPIEMPPKPFAVELTGRRGFRQSDAKGKNSIILVPFAP